MNQISNHFEYKLFKQKSKLTITLNSFTYICRDNFAKSAANVIVADVICQTAGERSLYSGKTKYRTDQSVPKIEPRFLRQLNKDSDQTDLKAF